MYGMCKKYVRFFCIIQKKRIKFKSSDMFMNSDNNSDEIVLQIIFKNKIQY